MNGTLDDVTPEFVISYSMWEHGEYVVTIRPDWEKPWRDLPIGYTLSEKDANTISTWLQGALPELWRIFSNTHRAAQANPEQGTISEQQDIT